MLWRRLGVAQHLASRIQRRVQYAAEMQSDEIPPFAAGEMLPRVRDTGTYVFRMLERIKERDIPESDPLHVAALNALEGLQDLTKQLHWLACRHSSVASILKRESPSRRRPST